MTGARVLVLTHSGDHFTVDRVLAALERRGGEPFRLDTDRFPGEVRLLAHEDERAAARRVVDGERALDLAEVGAVWLRRVFPPVPAEGLDPRLAQGCVRESGAALDYLLAALDGARWVNPPAASRMAECKARQARAARAAGLRVPRTLVTNDPDAVRAFHRASGGDVVAKMLTPLTVSMGPAPLAVRTSPVGPDDLDALDEGLRHAPMVFQERIEKALELRVACVGERLFAGAIDASASERGRTDWRGARPGEARWQPAELPDDVADALRAVVRSLGLVFGAADLVRTPEGDHVFLEVNPGGEWGMLERDLDLPISSALAEVLTCDPRS